MATEGKSCSLHHHPFLQGLIYLVRNITGRVVEITAQLWALRHFEMGKEQWRHLTVPETQSQLTCLFKQLGSGALLRKAHFKRWGNKSARGGLETLKPAVLVSDQYGFALWSLKGSGFWPTVLSPWLGGKKRDGVSSGKHGWHLLGASALNNC